MITIYDYIIIGFYLVFMLAIGVVFRRMSKDTSDYFRAGGAMPWWLTGASAWIFSFSAWTFTGAAGKVYEAGLLVLCVFYATIFGLLFAIVFTCLRFRRMRVITWMEAIRLRYGPFNEQFYIWIKLPLQLLFAGVGLNAIGVFMSAVFNVPMDYMLVILGVVVTLVAFAGGSWAVLASDFVQAFLIITITLCTAVMTLAHDKIGGITGLLDKVPSAHLNWSELARPELIFVWALATLWLKFSDENNMERSTMYLMTRSDKDARKMVLIPLIGTLVGPLIWFIPSMAATILHPDLASEFPKLKQPHEAAFLSVSMDVMPQGLLGLLLSAMLGATVTSMDAGLNKNVGIAIRSFYVPFSNALRRWKTAGAVPFWVKAGYAFGISGVVGMVVTWFGLDLTRSVLDASGISFKETFAFRSRAFFISGAIGLLLSLPGLIGGTYDLFFLRILGRIEPCITKTTENEKHLLIAGKLCTLLFGAIIIVLALYVNSMRETNLFDFVNQLASNLLMPLALPLIFGLFYKRTPGWSAWSTALVAGGASWLLGKYVTPELFQRWMGWETPLNGDEKTYLKLAITTLGGTVIVGSAWYFFTSLFYRAAPTEEKQRVDQFFTNLRTPVDKHGVQGVQTAVYKLLGTLCMVYGGFILLLMAIPNSVGGRTAFLFCGGVMFAVGVTLAWRSKRLQRAPAEDVNRSADSSSAR